MTENLKIIETIINILIYFVKEKIWKNKKILMNQLYFQWHQIKYQESIIKKIKNIENILKLLKYFWQNVKNEIIFKETMQKNLKNIFTTKYIYNNETFEETWIFFNKMEINKEIVNLIINFISK